MRIPSALCAAGAAIACAIVPSQAFAVSQDINLTADVAAECTIGGSDNPSAISQGVPVVAGQPTAAPIILTIPISCNARVEAFLTTVNGGLQGPAGIDGLSNRINYTASIDAPGLAGWSIDTQTATPGVPDGAGAGISAPHDNMTVTITPKTNPVPLRNGTYTDTLRITLTTTQ